MTKENCNFSVLYSCLDNIKLDDKIESILVEGEYKENIIPKSWLPIFIKLKHSKNTNHKNIFYKNLFKLELPFTGSSKSFYYKNDVAELESVLKNFLSDICVKYVRLSYIDSSTNIKKIIETGDDFFKKNYS